LLLALFLLLTVIDKFHTVSKSFQNQTPQNTISMSAEGKVAAVPDLATISLGVLTHADTAKKAQSDNADKSNEIIEFVKSKGIDAKDITTTQLSVYPSYDYTSTPSKIKGYDANQTLTVKIHGIDKSTEKIGAIIDGATSAGANQVQGVNLSFDDPDNLRQDARKQAIDKAKQKAQELADQAGLKLGRIVSISEGSVGYPVPLPYAYDSLGSKAMGGGVSSAPAIEPGSQDITATITVVFEVK